SLPRELRSPRSEAGDLFSFQVSLSPARSPSADPIVQVPARIRTIFMPSVFSNAFTGVGFSLSILAMASPDGAGSGWPSPRRDQKSTAPITGRADNPPPTGRRRTGGRPGRRKGASAGGPTTPL